MKYIEHRWRPIKPINEDCVYCQCVSADFLPHPDLLCEQIKWMDLENPDYMLEWAKMKQKGDCFYDQINGVMNLVIKSFIYEYCKEDVVREALLTLKQLTEWNQINALYFGNVKNNFSGIKWAEIRKMIEEIFANSDMEIYVKRHLKFKEQFEILKHIAERTRNSCIKTN